MDYFQVLEVPQLCSNDDVKKSYLRLAKQWHPDINKQANAAEKFKIISEAYEVLKDEVQRSHYRARLVSGHMSTCSSSAYRNCNNSYEPFDINSSDFNPNRGYGFRQRTRSNFSGFRRGSSGFILFVAPLVGIIGALGFILNHNENKSTISYQDSRAREQKSSTVEAWYNPK